MLIDKGFRFNANNLQDYVFCPRRFELKYILKQPYPSVVSQPVMEMEGHIADGNQFHLAVNQFLCGLPKGVLSERANSHLVISWLKVFFPFIEEFTHCDFLSEYTLFMPFQGFQLMARYDLIVQLDNGSILILDWKTSGKIPTYSLYQNRIQTVLYPYLLSECLPFSQLSMPVRPFDIQMQYWFPNFPEVLIRFPYSDSKHKECENLLKNLIQEITATPINEFHMTQNLLHCSYCQYRTLCERGNKAASYESADTQEIDLDDLIENITLDSLEEIQY